MKVPILTKVEWTPLDFDELIWKFPSEKIVWGSELVIKDYQAAAFFTKDWKFSKRLQIHDYFGDVGSYAISNDNLPIIQKAYPDISNEHFLHASVIFCSTKDYLFCRKVQGSEGNGSAGAICEADATCRFRIRHPELFFRNFVAIHKKTNDKGLLGYIGTTLGIELFRRNRPYGWASREIIGMEDWKWQGIELLSLEFEHYEERFETAGV